MWNLLTCWNIPLLRHGVWPDKCTDLSNLFTSATPFYTLGPLFPHVFSSLNHWDSSLSIPFSPFSKHSIIIVVCSSNVLPLQRSQILKLVAPTHSVKRWENHSFWFRTWELPLDTRAKGRLSLLFLMWFLGFLCLPLCPCAPF